MATKRVGRDDGKSGVPAKKGHWNLGLKDSMNDPNLQVYTDDKIVIIKDKYPKAAFHYLVLPHESIPNLKALKKSHIELLKHMHEKGRMIADRESAGVGFRFGYHAVPSMSHVHLHVISQDFNSPCLKTKKHWNSFTSSYFVNSEDLIKNLEETGSASVMTSEVAKKCLDLPLRCHKCKAVFPTMPKLKTHLLTHKL